MKNICFLVFACLILAVSGYGQKSRFVLNTEPMNIYSPLYELKINLIPEISGAIPDEIRQSLYKKVAGDYYRNPLNAPKGIISREEKGLVWNFLKDNIKAANYDSMILENISVFEYKLDKEEIPRRDCFLRYSEADTIYVISGWIGKFFSFYKAVPEIHKYKLSELNERISEIATFNIKIPKDAYEKYSKDNTYFIEYIDRERMLRIRCYHISEQRKGQASAFVSDPYTLIEITRFIDKEMVP